jgi:hypothetical protein
VEKENTIVSLKCFNLERIFDSKMYGKDKPDVERPKAILLIISVGVTIGDKITLIWDFHSLHDKYY